MLDFTCCPVDTVSDRNNQLFKFSRNFKSLIGHPGRETEVRRSEIIFEKQAYFSN